jgi:hypothetical protein
MLFSVPAVFITVREQDCLVGGYIKPANHNENRRDRSLAKNQNGKRQSRAVVRERGGRTLLAVSTPKPTRPNG